MGSLLNFVFLNDKLIGNGDGSYGITGPFFNYVIGRRFNYTLNSQLRVGFKNVLPIEITDAGFGIRRIPDAVFNLVNNNDIKLLLIGLSDPTTEKAYKLSLSELKDKIEFDKIIWIDSNITLSSRDVNFNKVYTFNYFIEESTWYIDNIFANRKNDLNYVSCEILPDELNNFRNKKFISFNRSVQKMHRFALLEEYIDGKFSDSYFSFIKKLDYFDEIFDYKSRERKIVDIDFYNSYLPIELDTQNSINKENFATSDTLKKELFLDSCINIVTETTFLDNELFLSEKILKPILSYQPFIVFGPHGYLAELKKYGFKTFSEFWDEGYDNIEDSVIRLKELMRVVKNLNNKSIEELNDIYKSTIEICIHNRNLLHSLKLDSLKVILGEIENEW